MGVPLCSRHYASCRHREVNEKDKDTGHTEHVVCCCRNIFTLNNQFKLNLLRDVIGVFVGRHIRAQDI